MLQNLTVLSVSLLLCVALSGCGREETTPTTTTPDQNSADVPILVVPEDE